MIRCDQGHFFDPGQHSSCPHCPIPGLNIDDSQVGHTVPVSVNRDSEFISPGHRDDMPVEGRTVNRKNLQASSNDGRTVGVHAKELGIDPVVGWLVCIDGPDRGRDYRIRSGRNFIGRSNHMHIAIQGDTSISREKHAIISYDPKHIVFKIIPGDSTEHTYLNGDTVDVPIVLKQGDVIEMGQTRLFFVPLCNERFQWQQSSE